ncbi:MAG: hypothetical protein UY12_C0007G0006 [Parcubacteria group bacterium GW2011_GWA2_47_8b]|uniref:Glycosyltransferase RgtA/B/C/D-like domain-containing protein n=3 Tax=Parcubacteria group TaxID=1794811 RepID=A0A0G1T604_9BACT|nr:MAG: hypothetical protein UY02_C0004G0009 [Candidatus Giovannonibacteria bacterium GW2011_GWB1_47_6b]KKU85208.1 MAG: hypothetical protein UY12_C0007G0006 [Parcubacteria group bacterium GW2011_GWA2_47_8b]OGY63503.1 MAG: hypothetical protein A3E64_02405 [Candidatus Harrisonbacteria bacterium RIFCSPHIGHO2_12_FULL_48_16]OGY68271.1 MAG: hypothetical protein A2214_02260 [Candidatus Harrisonbacteria bacterium RIFOXYA1_FULL_48_8]
MIKRFNWAFLLLGLVGLAVILQFSTSNAFDTDSLYHIKHSFLYRTEGIFSGAFPWTQYSVISTYAADLWYGFHILTLPLSWFSDLGTGIKVGGVLVTVISGLLVFAAFRRLKIKWPAMWVLVFLFATADVLYRFAMFRPHPLSLGLALLIFTYLNTESSRFSKIILFLAGFFFSWTHLSLSWLPILVWAVTAAVQILQKKKIYWQGPVAMASGLIGGLLLRPNPFGAAKLAYIQVVQLLFEKKLPLRFGRELIPFSWENFVDQLVPITIALAMAIIFLIWMIRKKERQQSSVWASLILAVIFFFLTFAVARRSNEVFVGFVVIFMALLFERYRAVAARIKLRSIVALLALVLVIYAPIKTVYRFDTYLANTFPIDHFKDAALWLKENSRPGDVVFNIHWDRFADLFFWNNSNYYINGMDPIFEYSFKPELYWKTHFLAIDAGTAFTCGMIRCTAEQTEDTYKVLKNDFRASYIVVEKLRNPKLLQYLQSFVGYQKVFDNNAQTVFRIM